MRLFCFILLIMVSCIRSENEVILQPNEPVTHESSEIKINLTVRSIFEHLSYFKVPNDLVDKVQGSGLGLMPEATFTAPDGTQITTLLFDAKEIKFHGYNIRVQKINRSTKAIESVLLQINKEKLAKK